MSAYDADRDISNITVQLMRRSNNSTVYSVIFHQSGENLYTGIFDCSMLSHYEDDYYVSKIRLEDETNNYVDWPVMEDGKYRYTFTFKDIGAFTVSDYQIEINSSDSDGKLKVGDTVTCSAHVECKDIEIENASLHLTTVDSKQD